MVLPSPPSQFTQPFIHHHIHENFPLEMRKHGTQKKCNFFLIRLLCDVEERFVLLLVYFGAQLKKISWTKHVWTSRAESRVFISCSDSLIDRHTYLDFIWSVDEHVVLELLSVFDGLQLLSWSDDGFPILKIIDQNIFIFQPKFRIELSLVLPSTQWKMLRD